MEITLNHTIVPSHNNVDSAKFYAKIFDFEFVKEWAHFAIVKVNSSLSLDFVTATKEFSSHHYAFKVSDQEFDNIFNRIKSNQISFGSGPRSLEDGEINHHHNGRGVYFKDPSNHILEIITTDYVLD